MMEQPIVFNSEGKALLGILHTPDTPSRTTGIVLVVGGPQTRVGSHRQFVFLARALCRSGYPVLRYDYSGMGDSEGEKSDYLAGSADLDCAIKTLKEHVPAVDEVALWGLCDAASLILLYLSQERAETIGTIFLLNPWVRQSQSEAQVYLKNYYLRRLRDPEFWKKLLSFRFDWKGSFLSLLSTVRKAVAVKKLQSSAADSALHASWQTFTEDGYVSAMAKGLQRYAGKCYLVLSGNDLTADEFRLLLANDPAWKALIDQKVDETLTLKDANHTFSSEMWRSEVETFCVESISVNNAK